MTARILQNKDTSYLDGELLDQNDLLTIKPSSFYDNIPYEDLLLWCHKNGIYCLPTQELIDWLKTQVTNETIEIGAGNGAIGRALHIPVTDSCLMRSPDVAMYYAMSGQPVVRYPADVIEMDAVRAVEHFRPTTVIGSWITHRYNACEHWRGGNVWGIDEGIILRSVKKYIMVGTETVHAKKPILDLPHKTLKFPWLYSRSFEHSEDVIYIWEN